MKKTPFFKTKAGLAIVIIIGLGVVFLIGSEYRAYQVRKAFSEAFSDKPIKNVNSKIIEKKIGEDFDLATIKVKVNGLEEKNTITSEFGTPAIAKENTKFVVLNLDITNITPDKFSFYTEGINLVDNKGRTFGTYDDAIGSIDNYLNVRDLSPSITEKGVLVYELPNDATNYSLQIDKGGTSERYKVVLK